MRCKFVFVISLVVSTGSFCGSVSAELVVPKFGPELRVNKKPEVCEPFLRSWQSIYASTELLRMTEAQLATDFGTQEVYEVGGDRSPREFSIDLDADGIDEHLLTGAVYRGIWYEGTVVYLFRDAAHRDEVVEYSAERHRDLRRLEGEGYDHGAIEIDAGGNFLFLITVGGRAYLVSSLSRRDPDAPWLYELNKEPLGERTPICEVRIRPDSDAMKRLVKQVDLIGLLQPIYGGDSLSLIHI